MLRDDCATDMSKLMASYDHIAQVDEDIGQELMRCCHTN
jgi:hypothetical protein